MPIRHLLYERSLPINEHIEIKIPTVGEVLDREVEYYGAVSLITATPYDLMVQLDDLGIDFTQITDYELFLITFESLKEIDMSLIFGGFDFTKLKRMVNTQTDMMVLSDPESGVVIDTSIYWRICDALRAIHHLKKTVKKPGNLEAQKYLLERARKKAKRKKKVEGSSLEGLIVALVNTEQFSYKFDEVRDLTIYQFNESVLQVVKKIDFDNRMHGIYSGTVSAKDMSQDSLNWLVH